MNLNDISQFYGVPVAVQLKSPYALVQPQGQAAAPYADDPKALHWVLGALAQTGPDGQPRPMLMQMLLGVVIHPVPTVRAPDERAWVMIAMPIGDETIVELLLPTEELFCVSRIASHSERSRLIKP